jgi:hypothetical protein
MIGQGDAVFVKGLEAYGGDPETCLDAYLALYPER